jgi:ribonuclease R
MSDVSIDLEERILKLFKDHPSRSFGSKEIARLLNLDFAKGSEDRQALGEAFNQLSRHGKILSSKRGFYRPDTENSNVRMIGDAKIPVETSYETFVGVVDRDTNGNQIVRPADAEKRAMAVESHNLPDGTIVTVQVRSDFNAAAKVIHDHGHLEQEAGLSKLSILAAGMPLGFDDDILDDVNLSIPPVSKYRKDYRHIPFITIDPETAKDFDDAICVRKKGKNWQVMVAVADVAHYVRPGTKVFEEAYSRGTSAYLYDHVEPMLPEELSNGVCSLKPNEDRACIVTTMTISPTGEILKYHIERGLMRSIARLHYDEVQEAIENTANRGIQSLFNKYISKAYGAFQSLLTDRMKRGALDLNAMEQRIEIKGNGKLSIKLEEGNESHGIIEELMIAANRCAADFLENKGIKYISRVHGKPNERVFAKMRGQLSNLGVRLPSPSLNIEAQIDHVLKQADTHPEGDVIRTLMTRVQDRAYYSTEPLGHFGLKLDHYTHKTSPIRRMTDLYIDLLLGEFILGGPKLPHHLKKKMARAAAHFSHTERRAQMVEEETSRRAVAKFIRGNLGETFNARVVKVSKTGVQIKVDDPEIQTVIQVKAPFDYVAGDLMKVAPTHADPVTGIVKFREVESHEESGQVLSTLSFMQPRKKGTARAPR